MAASLMQKGGGLLCTKLLTDEINQSEPKRSRQLVFERKKDGAPITVSQQKLKSKLVPASVTHNKRIYYRNFMGGSRGDEASVRNRLGEIVGGGWRRGTALVARGTYKFSPTELREICLDPHEGITASALRAEDGSGLAPKRPHSYVIRQFFLDKLLIEQICFDIKVDFYKKGEV